LIIRKKNLKILFVVLILSCIIFGLTRAGDLFLSFVGDKIHIIIDYKNYVGFPSCFLLRSVALDRPVFRLKDFDFALACQRALIEPRFNRLYTNRTIILDCYFENASLLGIDDKTKESDQSFQLFNGGLGVLFERLKNLVFEDVHTRLVVYGETVEFPYFEAAGKESKIVASGYVTESGDFKIAAKIFFSPEVAAEFPEELKKMLTAESRDWLSYSLSIESGQDKSFLKLESDRFRLNFERLDVR